MKRLLPLLLLLLCFVGCSKPAKPTLGLYRVTTRSMEPLLPIGTTVMVVRCESYKEGDVVLLDHPYYAKPVLHRLVAVGPKWVLSKGDANEFPDAGVSKDLIVGKALF